MLPITTEEFIPVKIGNLNEKCPFCNNKKNELYIVKTIARFGPLKLFKLFKKVTLKCKKCHKHFKLEKEFNKEILEKNKNIKIKQNLKEYCEFYQISTKKRKTKLIINYIGSFLMGLLFSAIIATIFGFGIFNSEKVDLFGIIFIATYILIMILQTYYFIQNSKER